MVKILTITALFAACAVDGPQTSQVEQHSGGSAEFDDLYVTTSLGVGSASAPFPDSLTWVYSGSDPTEKAQMLFYKENTNQTASFSTNITINQQGTVNTTAGPVTAAGLFVVVDPVRTTGSNTLTNVGILIDANAGDGNYALYATHGVIRADDGALLGHSTIEGLTLSGDVDINATSGSSFNWVGSMTVAGDVSFTGTASFTGNVRTGGNTLWFTEDSLTELYFFSDQAGSGSSNTSVNFQLAAGNGTYRFGSNTGGSTNTGTGGIEVYGGVNDSSANAGITGPGVVWGSSVRLGTGGPTWTSGAGAPTSSPPAGSLYSDTTNGALYVRGVSSWVLK